MVNIHSANMRSLPDFQTIALPSQKKVRCGSKVLPLRLNKILYAATLQGACIASYQDCTTISW